MNELWQKVDHLRPESTPLSDWKKSYDGTSAALATLHLIMITTKNEFDAMSYPIDKKGKVRPEMRTVVVSRENVVSKPIAIQSLLSQKSRLLTKEEHAIVNAQRRDIMKAARPKGSPITNRGEAQAIDDMHTMIDITAVAHCEHLHECRAADVAYCHSYVDKGGRVFVGDQVKSVQVCTSTGTLSFNVTVAKMISILQQEISLTFIAKNADGKVAVVWVFDAADIENLSSFEPSLYFSPKLYLQRKSTHVFTTYINDRDHRYDIIKFATERIRLRDKKIAILNSGTKNTLRYWNEDTSQIWSSTNRTELASFLAISEACKNVGMTVTRNAKDAYGPVDFHIGMCRIQDKAITGHSEDERHRDQFAIRSRGKHPYNPDDIDILQVSILNMGIVYAVPMRKVIGGMVFSFYDEEELLQNTVRLTKAWRERHARFAYNLALTEDVRRYVRACDQAAHIPELHDRTFYKIMLSEADPALFVRPKSRLQKAASDAKRCG